MDGINYSECEMPFKIYSNEISLNTISPKSGSVNGGSDLVINLDLDEVTANSIQNLTVGFKPKQRKVQRVGSLNTNHQNSRQASQDGGDTSKHQDANYQQDEFGKPLNIAGDELQNWTCS